MANRSRSRQLRAVIKRDGMRCHYCDVICMLSQGYESGNQPNTATREHVVPKSQGGSNEMHNIVMACRKCNNKRGDGPQICFCIFCTRAYELTWKDQFNEIIAFAYNKVYKTPSGRWAARYKGDVRSFKTWEMAMWHIDYEINKDMERSQNG